MRIPNEPMEQEGQMAMDDPYGDLSPEEQWAEADAASGGRGRTEHIVGQIGDAPQEIDPQQLRQIETINAAMVDMMYNPKTKSQIQKSLQSGPPEMTIPAVTNMVMGRFEDIMRPKNGELSLDMKLVVGTMTFSEVTDLAAAMGVLPQEGLNEESTTALLRQTMQQYIRKGLKEKTIDPIELQMAVEPLMTPEEQLMAQKMGGATGAQLPSEPTQQMQMQTVLQQKMMPLEVENKNLKNQTKQMQSALQGIAAETPEGQ